MSDIDRVLVSIILCLIVSLGVQHYQLIAHPRPPEVVVRVNGGVVRPQIVRLPQGARVVHAITACGGYLPEAQSDEVPLARLLEDGENLTIPIRTASLPEPQPTRDPPRSFLSGSQPVHSDPPSRKLDLNSASFDELQTVPGIGPALAGRILEARDGKPGGYFRSLEDLTDVRGIKGKTLERLRPHLKIEGS